MARNLDLPTDDIAEAFDAALTGTDRPIDVGRVAFDDGPEEVFLVMTGMGLDADTVDADEGVKAVVGVLAYVASGVKAVFGRGFGLTIASEDDVVRRQRARMVVVGNCGELTGGLELLPDAAPDDGRLDAVVASPTGIVGWIAVLVDVLTRHRRGHPRLRRLTGTAFDARTARPVTSEIDGDVIGPRRRLVARVEPQALTVRAGRERSA